MTHTCHAIGCPVEVPPRMLMCRRHWRMVPAELQRAVWAAYREGQEIDKRPSVAWHHAADAAIAAVLALELASPAEPEQADLFAHNAPALGVAHQPVLPIADPPPAYRRTCGCGWKLELGAGCDECGMLPDAPDPFDTDDGP